MQTEFAPSHADFDAEGSKPSDVATLGRWLLTAASLGVGAIHIGVAADHWNYAWQHGAFMFVVGWIQLAWAAGIVFCPSRKLLVAGVVGNALVVAVWAVTRVWGAPFGADAWMAESVARVDLVASGLEIGLVLGALGLLAERSTERRASRAVSGLAVGAALVSVGGLCAFALNPDAVSADHRGGAGHGSADAAAVLGATTTPCDEAVGPKTDAPGGHGHRGPTPELPIADPATKALLADQLTEASAAVARYPTVAAAEADGYVKSTLYVPCIGAHYTKGAFLGDPLNAAEPEEILFDGTEPDSRIVGLSYVVTADPNVAPDGFAGPNDPWHKHPSICIELNGNFVLAGELATPEQCAELGGTYVDTPNFWMAHLWAVPGWENPWGTFSPENPKLGGRLGDINGQPDPEDTKRQGTAL